PKKVGITPLFFEHTFYCKRCGAVVSAKTCPHDTADHIVLSGTQVREMLSRGDTLPVEFTRPEVSAILMQAYQNQQAWLGAGLEVSLETGRLEISRRLLFCALTESGSWR